MSDDSIFSDIARLIPGYGAYRDQEQRRTDDRLTREFLGRRLSECKSRLERLGREAVERGDLELPAKLERLRERVDLAQSRLSAAVEGYASWFGERTVDAALLKDVADLDANLISFVDRLDAIARDWSQEANDEFAMTLDRLHERIDRRSEILKGGK